MSRQIQLKGFDGRGRKSIEIPQTLIISIYNNSLSTTDRKHLSEQHGFSLATFYRRLEAMKKKHLINKT